MRSPMDSIQRRKRSSRFSSRFCFPYWHLPRTEKAFPPVKVDVSLVSLTATVTDPVGRSVAGLNQNDFQIYEEGILQNTAVFHNDDTYR